MRTRLILNTRLRLISGATLMEVLITMVIMLFGLLGLSQLFTKAQRTANEAYDRHRALSMANYMSEMMRSMMRSQEVNGAPAAAADACPTAAQIPADGVLTNEQTMACFVELSHPTGRGNPTLGRFFNENVTTQLATTKAALAGCTSATGNCNSREMVSYILNTWTESLSNISQTNTTATAGAVFSNRGFTAHGCIDRLCNVDGENFAAGSCDDLQGTYRVRVYWRSNQALARDNDRNYCNIIADDTMRYTFVDVALPAPNKIR